MEERISDRQAWDVASQAVAQLIESDPAGTDTERYDAVATLLATLAGGESSWHARERREMIDAARGTRDSYQC